MMPNFSFDPTINIGQVALAIGFIGSVASLAVSLKTGQVSTQLRLDKIDEELKQQTSILIDLARQEERIRAMEARLERLSIAGLKTGFTA
jgi:K+/H+ antiporter YhaU regulatory subunit KhtT